MMLRAHASWSWPVILLLLSVGRPAAADETYPNGLPGDPSFFPIGVWLQSPARAANYKAIGINTYIALWDGPTEAQLAQLARAGMFAIAQQNDVGLKSASRQVVKGWMQGDEPDDAQALAAGGYGPCIPAADVAAKTQALKARDATRQVMVNFGPGLADEPWIGRGSCTGDVKYYDQAIKGADILSFDIYPVTSDVPRVQGKLEYVARGVTNLLRRADSNQKVWAMLETTAISAPRRPMPAQTRAETWMALIHGAKGIGYFVHEFSPFREDAVFRYPDMVQEITSTNQLIKTLAPVLNAPSVDGKVVVDSAVPVATMVKLQGNTMYVFAVAMKDVSGPVRFTIKGLDHATGRDLAEQRDVTVAHGAIEASFDGYGVHLYQIPLDDPAK